MKTKIILLATLVALAAVSCSKKEDPAPVNNPTSGGGGGGGGGGFTPPTTNYWKIDGNATTGSADAFNVNINANTGGLSKPFGAPIDGYCNISLDFNPSKNVRPLIAEGTSVAFPIAKKRELGSTPTGDSVAVNITVNDQSGSDAGYYYYVATGGTVYITKTNGKLRYTTNGVVNMIGVKSTSVSSFNYTTNIDFSWLEL